MFSWLVHYLLRRSAQNAPLSERWETKEGQEIGLLSKAPFPESSNDGDAPSPATIPWTFFMPWDFLDASGEFGHIKQNNENITWLEPGFGEAGG